MSKPVKMRPIGAKPTPEEQAEAATRAFMQKRNSLAEGILFNSLRHITPETPPEIMHELVDLALDAADYYMQKVYLPGEEKSASEE